MWGLPSPTAALRLLAWYEGTPVLRGLVQRLPFGTGTALDLALVGTLAGLTSARRTPPPGRRGHGR
jgi:hypothetical protein